jgi:hypothetical protein
VNARGKLAGTPRGLPLPKLRLALLVAFLVAIYVDVPLYVSQSFFIPSVFVLLVLMPILAAMYHRRIYKYEAAFVGGAAVVLALSALLSPGIGSVDQKLLGLMQTVVSICSGILLLKLLNDLRGRRVEQVLLMLSVALVVGALLEVVGVLNTASDSFRELAFRQSGFVGFYDADERDIGITGFPRPKLFTAEPSFLAVGFLAFANSWLVLAYSRKNLILACLGTLLMFVLVGSPVIVLSLATSLTVALLNEPRLSSLAVTAALLCIGGLGLASVQPEVFASFFERVVESYENVGTLKPTSENRRIIFPFLTVVDVILNSPFFGVGISGKEVIERYSTLPLDPDIALGNNVLAMFLMYLGLLGALLFGKITLDYWRRAGIGRIVLLLALILALSQTIGGFESPKFWGYVFLFTGVVKKASVPEGRWLEAAPGGRAVGRKRLRGVPSGSR